MAKAKGLDELVAARGYAMAGIFIGHVVLAYYMTGNKNLLFITKWMQIAFIPFFIFLTGAFYAKPPQRFKNFVWLRFCQRMIPVYFYLLLVIPFIVVVSRHGFYHDIGRWLPLYLVGIPMLSWPSWFLVALFTSELFYFFFVGKIKKKPALLAVALALYVIAWAGNTYKLQLPVWVDSISMIAMLQAVPFFLMCFLLGAAFKKTVLNMRKWSKAKLLLVFVISQLLTFVGVYLNNSFAQPEVWSLRHYLSEDMPMIFIGQYGHGVWFLLSCLAGIVAFLSACYLLPAFKIIKTMGDYSLILLGLNGVFHQVLNGLMVKQLPLPGNTWYWGLAYAVVLGFIQLLLSVWVAKGLQHYLPQLVGKPMLKGPLLPAIYRAKR